MVNFDAWLGESALQGDGATPQASIRAAAAWRRIQAKPTSITIRRSGEALDAQTVRVEYNSSAEHEIRTTTTQGVMTATVFGIQDHATLPDTDIRQSDRFVLDGQEFVVIQVINTLGELQAVCEKRAN